MIPFLLNTCSVMPSKHTPLKRDALWNGILKVIDIIPFKGEAYNELL